MNRNQRVVTRLPAEELWAGERLVSTIKVRDLDASDIADMLRAGEPRFVVADVGKPFDWIPSNGRFDFWKGEVKAHLASPESEASLEDFPGQYCYFASEWKGFDGSTIILLSKSH
ncbi:MAG TPA: hypothetical protein VIP46_09450 [Pyrinomonadaceae bacterium]